MLNIGDGNFSGLISGAGGIVRVSTFRRTTLGDRQDHSLRRQHLYRRHDDLGRHAAARQWRHHRDDRRQCRRQWDAGLQPLRTATHSPVSISGTGGCAQIGTGTTILTANNTYTGGTTISAGTLQLGNGGTTGSIVGNVVDNGALAFNRSDAYAFAGPISGSGSLPQIGTGTTI